MLFRGVRCDGLRHQHAQQSGHQEGVQSAPYIATGDAGPGGDAHGQLFLSDGAESSIPYLVLDGQRWRGRHDSETAFSRGTSCHRESPVNFISLFAPVASKGGSHTEPDEHATSEVTFPAQVATVALDPLPSRAGDQRIKTITRQTH